AREINDAKPGWVLEKVRQMAAGLDRPTVACLGLSFKPNIDDLRESPAVGVAAEICRAGWGDVLLVEPHIASLPASLAIYSNAYLCEASAALEKADILVLLVDHQQFKSLRDKLLVHRLVVDTRG